MCVCVLFFAAPSALPNPKKLESKSAASKIVNLPDNKTTDIHAADSDRIPDPDSNLNPKPTNNTTDQNANHNANPDSEIDLKPNARAADADFDSSTIASNEPEPETPDPNGSDSGSDSASALKTKVVNNDNGPRDKSKFNSSTTFGFLQVEHTLDQICKNERERQFGQPVADKDSNLNGTRDDVVNTKHRPFPHCCCYCYPHPNFTDDI